MECLLPRKRGFCKCMGAMLANPCHPYIQRGYRPFVIDRHKNIIACAMLVVEVCRFLLTLRGWQTAFVVFSQKVNTIMMCLHAHVQVYNVCHYLGFSIC